MGRKICRFPFSDADCALSVQKNLFVSVHSDKPDNLLKPLSHKGFRFFNNRSKDFNFFLPV